MDDRPSLMELQQLAKFANPESEKKSLYIALSYFEIKLDLGCPWQGPYSF